jgi:hypothetical protein
MGILSSKLNKIIFGVAGTPPSIERCAINSTGAVSGLNSDTGSGLLVSGDLKSNTKVWNAVWNDIADFQLLNDELIFGKCYYDTKDGARICTERCQMSVIGIASDTFGFGVGAGAHQQQVPIAVAGWVLAYVDKEYECGTPLTNDETGQLVEISLQEKRDFPERIVALYKRKEMQELWGPEGSKIQVNGRHWIKVK